MVPIEVKFIEFQMCSKVVSYETVDSVLVLKIASVSKSGTSENGYISDITVDPNDKELLFFITKPLMFMNLKPQLQHQTVKVFLQLQVICQRYLFIQL